MVLSGDVSNNEITIIKNEIVAIFKNIRRNILFNKPELFDAIKRPRGGDLSTIYDHKLWQVYRSLEKKHKMLIIAEESTKLDRDLPTKLINYKYVMIIDSLDASCNFANALPFGVNIAICKPIRNKVRFSNIGLVFIADYISGKCFIWDIVHGFDCRMADKFHLKKKIASNLYEIPDEYSYYKQKYPVGPKKQEHLIMQFRKLFPKDDYQRRAIDCTGLRMLEVYDKNLIAYGDMRRATHIWDVVPSIKFLIETKYIVLKGSYKPFTNNDIILQQENGRIIHKMEPGEFIVMNKSDAKRLVKLNTLEKERKLKPKCFIVHGHDSGLKNQLIKYIKNDLKFGNPILLEEKPSNFRTISQKFVEESREANIIFVLMTPDDIGRQATVSQKTQNRCRQNVILELGFFWGKFQKTHNCIILLLKGNLELPSDILDINWIDVTKGIHSKSEVDTKIRRELNIWFQKVVHQ